MSMNMDHVIGLEAVDKHYGKAVVVDGIDLQVHGGEGFVLVGHNGAGKTTIMKIMLGLTRPSAGQVLVLGEDPASRSNNFSIFPTLEPPDTDRRLPSCGRPITETHDEKIAGAFRRPPRSKNL